MADITEVAEVTEGGVKTIKSIATLILDSPPSCLQFSLQHPEIFVVGTYKLEADSTKSAAPSSEQVRKGSLIVLEVKDQAICLLETCQTDHAILDIHSREDDSTKDEYFAVATSKGTVDLYLLDLKSSQRLTKTRSFTIADESILVLSLDWNPWQASREIALSLSDGGITVLSFNAFHYTMTKLAPHSLEAWTTAWLYSPHSWSSVLYSGGDDSTIFTHQKQPVVSVPNSNANEDEKEEPYQIIASDKKTHGAGVTAILSIGDVCDGEDGVLVTGSYDERVRVLSASSGFQRFRTLAEAHLDGGVWRLQFLSCGDFVGGEPLEMLIVASCMHAGTRVLKIRRSAEGAWSIKILARFIEHESMNYATGLATELEDQFGENVTAAVSSSFYDKKLCLWTISDT